MPDLQVNFVYECEAEISCSKLFISYLGVKEYSKWPTIPQVFFGGEFVGGCDIMLDMHKSGELIDELQKLGIRSALMDDPDKKA